MPGLGAVEDLHHERVMSCNADMVVPLAVLLSAGSEPTNLKSEGSQPAILSEKGKKRYFVCHGGPPVSKDGVTLDQVAKIDRYVLPPYSSHFLLASSLLKLSSVSITSFSRLRPPLSYFWGLLT